MEAPTSWSLWLVLWNINRWKKWHFRPAGRQDLAKIETRFTLCYREKMWVNKERHIEKTNGGGMKRSVRICLRRENVEVVEDGCEQR